MDRWRARVALVPITARAALIALAVEVGLRVWSLPRLCAALRVSLATDTGIAPVEVSEHGGREWAAACRAYRRWPSRDTCLRRALVTGFMLRSEHPALRLGVASREGTSLAHAWLEIDGRAVGELPTDFSPLHGSRR